MGKINFASQSNTSLKSVILIGYQDQGNLGLGYLSSVLRNNGIDVHIMDINNSVSEIVNSVEKYEPILIGFSLIFQYFLPRFANIVYLLRIKNVKCHITIGGHYPSLRYKEVFEQIPGLDSVVLYEGEETLLELVEYLSDNKNWQSCKGIAYKTEGEVILNELRLLIEDLDCLPFPYRPFESEETLGIKKLPILATRGCLRNCAFCSIREFYKRAPGKIVRKRSPANVVKEIRYLFEEKGVRIFLFQDDDFPVLGKSGEIWVNNFIMELEKNNLIGKVIWKISCRVDEVRKELFLKMRNAGLYIVYLGIEAGTAEGLKTLNKQVGVDDIKNAIKVLKELNLLFGYGFMLFEPESDFERIKGNVDFLRDIIGDGSAAVAFCKMLPYAGTPIEEELKKEGRLRGSISQPDYNFLDPALDEYYRIVGKTLSSWLPGPNSVSYHLSLLHHEVAIIKKFFPEIPGIYDYEKFLREKTILSNKRILDTVEDLVDVFNHEVTSLFLSKEMNTEAQLFLDDLLYHRNEFVFHNQDIILETLNEEYSVM